MPLLPEERGELLDIANERAIKELPFPLAPQLQEMNEQIRLIENITADNQRVYFSSGSAFEALDTIGMFQDGRNEVENEQIIAYFGRSNVTTSAEWRKRHLHQTQKQIDEANANAEVLKGLRS